MQIDQTAADKASKTTKQRAQHKGANREHGEFGYHLRAKDEPTAESIEHTERNHAAEGEKLARLTHRQNRVRIPAIE